MSERIEWTPSEQEIESAPSVGFTCQLGRFALRPWDTSLFTYQRVGGMDMFNHIFHITEESNGLYIPEHYIETKEYADAYHTIQEYMFENDYPAHLNMTEVSGSDVRIITAMMASDMNRADEVPEEWT